MAAPPTYTTEQRAHALTRLIANHGNVSATVRELQAAGLTVGRDTLRIWRDASGLAIPPSTTPSTTLASQAPAIAELVVERSAEIAFSDIRDLMEWDEHGVTVTPSRDLTDAAARTINSVKCKELSDKDGNVTSREWEIKREPKAPFMMLLARHSGVIQPDKPDGDDRSQHLHLHLGDTDDATLERRAAAARAILGQG